MHDKGCWLIFFHSLCSSLYAIPQTLSTVTWLSSSVCYFVINLLVLAVIPSPVSQLQEVQLSVSHKDLEKMNTLSREQSNGIYAIIFNLLLITQLSNERIYIKNGLLKMKCSVKYNGWTYHPESTSKFHFHLYLLFWISIFSLFQGSFVVGETNGKKKRRRRRKKVAQTTQVKSRMGTWRVNTVSYIFSALQLLINICFGGDLVKTNLVLPHLKLMMKGTMYDQRATHGRMIKAHFTQVPTQIQVMFLNQHSMY